MELIDMAERPEPAQLVARMADRKRRTGTRLPAEGIIQHRDADCR